MKTKLEKKQVCVECFDSANAFDCVCYNGKYNTILLEFEVCECCGHLINNGIPADTEFNKNQILNYKNK